MKKKKTKFISLMLLSAFFMFSLTSMSAQTKKPNILVIWGDDVGYSNISINSQGMMGYQTPNIDRIGKEGAVFTDWYAQQSCTAGRSTLITGQTTLRTGLSKVGLPGGPNGMRSENPTIATALKSSDI